MMFKITDSVAANTTRHTAQIKKLSVGQGIIKRWDIGAPMEGINILNLRVLYHDQQLIPFNRDSSVWPALIFDPIPDEFPLLEPPYELEFRSWNTDTVKAHIYWVRVVIIPEEPVGGKYVSPSLMEKIKARFGGGE